MRRQVLWFLGGNPRVSPGQMCPTFHRTINRTISNIGVLQKFGVFPGSAKKIFFKHVQHCLMQLKNISKLFHYSQCLVKWCTRLITSPDISSSKLIRFTSYICLFFFFSLPKIKNLSSPVLAKWWTKVLQILNWILIIGLLWMSKNRWHRCDDCALAITDAIAQFGLWKCSMKCSVHLSTLQSNIEKLWLFYFQCSVHLTILQSNI